MTLIRDFFRRRRVAKHVKANGWTFEYHGLRFRLPENSNATVASALLRDKYEAEEIRMIQSHVPTDKPVIELGGSLGVVSGIIGAHVDKGKPHLVVEANPHLQGICLENASAGGPSDGLEVLERAVSYHGPKAVFELAPNPHGSGLKGDGSGGTGEIVEVPAITLKALHTKLGSPEGYSLVCDIEGGEADMVAKDGETIAKAGVVVLELHPTITPEAAAAIPGQMDALGFKLVDRAGDVYTWTKG